MASTTQGILKVFGDQTDFKEVASKSLVILSLVLYVFSILTTHVSVLEANFLAMIKEYPATYWISIILMLVAICLSKEKMNYLKVSLLFVYLVNTPLLVESNVRIPSAYWPLGLAGQINKTGTMVDTISRGPYTYFPGYPFFASVVSQVSGMPLDVLVKVLSIVVDLALMWNVLVLNKFLLISLRVPERLRSRVLIFSTLLFIASSWINIMYFHPMSMALLMFILLLNVASKNQFMNSSATAPQLFTVIFVYFSIVITHPLIPIFIISFAILYYMISFVIKSRKRDFTQPLLFTTLYMVWIVFQASSFTSNTISDVVRSIGDSVGLFSSASLGRSTLAGSNDYSIVFWTRVGLMAVILGLALSGLIKVLMKQRTKIASKKDVRKIVTTLVLAYIFGAVPLLLFSYGGEIFIRVFFILLPLLIFLASLAFGRRKIVLVALTSILLLMMPIASIGDESTVLVSDYEIKGAAFFQERFTTDSRYLYEFPALIFYFDTYGPPHYKDYVRIAKSRFNQTFINAVLAGSTWDSFLDSQVTRNYYKWYLGSELAANLRARLINVTLMNTIYDNGDFRIFVKT